MATSNRDVKMTLGVGVTGTEDVQQLAGGLKDVATAGTAAAPGVEKLGAELAALELRTKELRAAEATARAEVALQKSARDEQRDALARLRAETDAAGRASDAFKTKERELKLAIIDGGAALRDKQKALATASTGSQIAAAESAKLVAQIQEVNAAYRQQGAAAAASAKQQAAAHAAAGAGLDTLKDQLSSLRNVAMAAVGGSFISGLAKDVADTADAYNNLQARMRLVTGEGPAFQAAFEGVTAVAQRTGSTLESTGNLFTKIAESGKAMGVGQADALKLTETINQAVQLSGASAQASDAAITQLIQGLQSGVLRGDEFNSIMEQAPRLSRALAEGLSVTTGELRKMAEAGALSSDVVIKALRGQADVVASEFSKLPPTVGRAITNLSTAWTLYVGETDKATGASTTAASAINALSTNLKTVAGYLIDASQAGALFVALKLAQHFTSLALSAGQSAAAVTANAAAITATSAASTTAAANVGRFAAIMGGLKTLTLVGLVSNFHDIGVAIGEGAAKLVGYKDRTNELAAAEKTAAAIAADTIAMRKRQAEATQDAIDKTFQLSIVAKAGIAEFDKLTKEGIGAAEAIAKIGKDFDLASVPGIKNAAAVLDKLTADGKLSASEFRAAWGAALKGEDLAVFETKAQAAFAGTAREGERLGQVLDVTLREALKRTALDFDVISGGMGKASRSAINDTDAMINGLDRLKVMGVDTAQALTASLGKGINTADSQKAIEAVKAQIEAVRKVLGDKVADGLLDQAKQKTLDLKDALDKAKPGVNSLREAMELLGLKSRESLDKTAKTAQEAYDFIKAKGQDEGESYVAWQARKDAAARVMLERLIAANGGVITEAIKARAAMEGIDLSSEKAGRSMKNAFDSGSDAASRFTQNAGASLEELKRMEAALDALNGKYGQSKAHRDGTYKLDEQTKAKPGQIDLTAATKLLDATNSGRPVDMTSAELAQAKEQAKAAYDATQTALRNAPGLVSFDAIQSTEALYRASMNSNAVNITDKPAGTAAPTAQQPGSTTTVNINIGGNTTAVKVASQSDANSLTAVLRQLEALAGVSA